VGIAEENIGKIFRHDVQFSSRGTDNETGTGLGLMICKDFIERHGGKIWLESELNKGSVFSFSLPLTHNKQDIQATA
jgi:signal transduction histidine kinase